jgi:hypothetical protein
MQDKPVIKSLNYLLNNYYSLSNTQIGLHMFRAQRFDKVIFRGLAVPKSCFRFYILSNISTYITVLLRRQCRGPRFDAGIISHIRWISFIVLALHDLLEILKRLGASFLKREVRPFERCLSRYVGTYQLARIILLLLLSASLWLAFDLSRHI